MFYYVAWGSVAGVRHEAPVPMSKAEVVTSQRKAAGVFLLFTIEVYKVRTSFFTKTMKPCKQIRRAEQIGQMVEQHGDISPF